MSASEHQRRLFKKWSRTFHIYLSMLGLLGILFFAVTGLMLNHEEWFALAEPHVSHRAGTIATNLLREPDKLAIVEKLRKEFGAVGALDSFEIEDDQLTVVFKGPARRATASISRPDGRTQMVLEFRNAAARLTELHRGVEAGAAWRVAIDAIAAVQIVSALTGILLWWLVPRWRPLGLLALGICGLTCLLLYWLVVP